MWPAIGKLQFTESFLFTQASGKGSSRPAFSVRGQTVNISGIVSHVVTAATPRLCCLHSLQRCRQPGEEWAWLGSPALCSGKQGVGGVCPAVRSVPSPGLSDSHTACRLVACPACAPTPHHGDTHSRLPDKPACSLLETQPLEQHRLNRADSAKCFIPACRLEKTKNKKLRFRERK